MPKGKYHRMLCALVITAFLIALLLPSFGQGVITGVLFFFPLLVMSVLCFDIAASLHCKKSTYNSSGCVSIGTLLLLSTESERSEELLAACESLARRFPSPELFIGTVITPTDSICLKKQSDDTLCREISELYEHLCRTYGNRFCFFVRRRQYDPAERCFFGIYSRSNDIFDIITYSAESSAERFDCIFGASVIRKCAVTVSLPRDRVFTDGDLRATVTPLISGGAQMVRSVGVSSPLCTEGVLRAAVLENDGEIYAFDNAAFRRAFKKRAPFDSCSDRLSLVLIPVRHDGRMKKESSFERLCRESRSLLLTGDVSDEFSFGRMIRRIVAHLRSLDLFCAFLLLLLSVREESALICTIVSLVIVTLPALGDLFLRLTASESGGLLGFFSTLQSSITLIVGRLAYLPYAFTLGAYILALKLFCALFKGDLKRRHFDGAGALFAAFTSNTLFALVFLLPGFYRLTALLSLIWIIAPIFEHIRAGRRAKLT